MQARYVVIMSVYKIGVKDTKEDRTICYCAYVADANNIAKAMNVSNSWDPILMTNEMGPSNYIKKE